MSLRILFVASLHHPEELRAAIADTPAGEKPPLFPPSMAQHFYEKALGKQGHRLAVFYANLPVFGREERATRQYTARLTPGKLVAAAIRRIPPQLNPDYQLRNRRLIEKARQFQPDVLWVMGGTNVIYPQTLETIKYETSCKLLYANGTSPVVFSHPIERRAVRVYDLVIVSDYYHGIQWLELGAKRMEVLPISACDPNFHRSYELTDAERTAYQCDVTFVGTLVPDSMYSRRVRALEALRDFDLGIWSIHEVPPSLREFVRGCALGKDTLKILSAAKICFNNHANFVFYGTNIRVFETAGVGAFQITDDLPGVRQHFKVGENIEIFRDTDDLHQKVAYYLAHAAERQAIAQRAQQHVYQFHTYDHRLERIEALIEEL